MTDTIEDILIEIMRVDIKEVDRPVLTSMRNQVIKGIGLTDRQFELAKKKILGYKDELTNIGINDIDTKVTVHKLPLRNVDRSKTISLVANEDITLAAPGSFNKDHSSQLIRVRFPFNKKLISAIKDLVEQKQYRLNRVSYYHPRGSDCHYFSLTERNISVVVDGLKDRNFTIDQELLDMNEEIAHIRENKAGYIPGLYNGKLLNLHSKAEELIAKEINNTDPLRELKLADRKFKYNLGHIEYDAPTSLVGIISLREEPRIKLDPKEHSMDEIAQAFITLERFPLLVIVDSDNELEQLKSVHTAFASVDSSQQSVLFRVKPSKDNSYNANNYIQDHSLNNWVDENTKIVYIIKNKLPKVLLKADWQPTCALGWAQGNRLKTHVSSYIKQHSDLRVLLEKATDRNNPFNNELM